MAYLDLDSRFARPVGGPKPAAPPSDTPAMAASFSPLEWSVVALAKRDPMRSLAAPSPLSRAMRGLFGLGSASRLADGRLEALRRTAVYAWRRGFAIPKPEIARFLEAGFSEEQLELMVESITGWRVPPRRARAA